MNTKTALFSRFQLPVFIILLAAAACSSPPGTSASPNPDSSSGAAPAPGIPASQAQDKPSLSAVMAPFDYFVLALSWAPDYCSANGSQDGQECAPGKKLGFVLHGLWPQNNRGYPSSCSTEKLGSGVKAAFPGLYPNDALYDHEWEKHGTCTGLDPQQYLALARQLKASVLVPADFKAPPKAFRISTAALVKDFTAANTSLSPASLAVYCSGSGRFFSELFVCFSRDAGPTACSVEVLKKASQSCSNTDFLVRNTP